MWREVLALGGSYVLGSIPTAYLFVKSVKGIDVRTIGSGNVGATNVTRAAGLRAGLVVFVVDCLKGLAAVQGCARLAEPFSPGMQLACGLAAVIGHCFPIFLGFRGGKGVSTMIGVMIGIAPMTAAAGGLVWGIAFWLWRYVSLASLLAIAVLPIGLWLGGRPAAETVLAAGIVALIVARHHGNLQRLAGGTESRWAGRQKGS